MIFPTRPLKYHLVQSVATPGNNVALGFSFRPSQQRLSFTSTEQKPLEPSHLKGPQKRPLLLGRSLADLVAIKRPFPKARYSIRSEIKSIDEISIAEGLEVHSPCDELAASSDFDLADEALQKPRPAQVADSPPRLLPKDLSNDPSPIETSDGDDVIVSYAIEPFRSCTNIIVSYRYYLSSQSWMRNSGAKTLTSLSPPPTNRLQPHTS